MMTGEPPSDTAAWKKIVARYQQPSRWRGVWQIVNSLVPYAVLWYLIYLGQAVSWWIALPLTVLAGGFLVRLFIIHHDCGHGSFFKSRKANDVWGFITGVLTFTPYQLWRWEHAIHHSASGDLDRRGLGSVWTLTVQEYLEASRWKRFAYRLARNPFVLFVLAPFFLFVIKHRFCPKQASRRERQSVHWTNLAILGMAIGLSLIFGFKAYLAIQLTMVTGGRLGRGVAVLRATPVRGSLLATARAMGLSRGSAARQFILQAAENSPMVFGQHRLPSHSPFKPANSQLQSGAVPPGGAAVSNRAAGHALLQPQILDLPPLGREAAPAGWFQPSAKFPVGLLTTHAQEIVNRA